jgi:hypothetical protein
MPFHGPELRWLQAVAIGLLGMLALSVRTFAQGSAPVVTIGPGLARVEITAASLADVIDALARAGSFKVSYEGPRPTAMLYKTEIDTPSVSRTLFRLLEGQNLNYGLVMDPTGRQVTTLIILGLASRTAAAPNSGSSGGRPQPFATPRPNRNPALDVPPEVAQDEPPGVPEPTPTPTPVEIRPVAPPSMGPRMPFGRPFGPRPSPSASPTASP